MEKEEEIARHDSSTSKETEQFDLIDPESNKDNEVLDENTKSSEETIIADIMKAIQERKKLTIKNNQLQHKLSLFIKESIEKDKFQITDLLMDANEDLFRKFLANIEDKQKEMEEFNKNTSEKMEGLKMEIEERENELKELNNSFTDVKGKTALLSVNSDSGECYSKNDVQELLRKEEEMRKALEHCQLEALESKHILHKTKKEKKNMVEGPLDFGEYEVMCTVTENNAEVTKQLKQEIGELMKKSSNTVNILCHLQQKLQAVLMANLAAEEKEKQLEDELKKMRKELFKEKNKFTKLNTQNEDLQHKTILLQYPKLIEDYKQILMENEEAQKELNRLRNIYKSTKRLLNC